MTDVAQARLEKARETADAVYRSGDGSGEMLSVLAALALLNELDWQPPIDPDLLAVREIVAAEFRRRDCPNAAAQAADGTSDRWVEIVGALAAYKAGKAAR